MIQFLKPEEALNQEDTVISVFQSSENGSCTVRASGRYSGIIAGGATKQEALVNFAEMMQIHEKR